MITSQGFQEALIRGATAVAGTAVGAMLLRPALLEDSHELGTQWDDLQSDTTTFVASGHHGTTRYFGRPSCPAYGAWEESHPHLVTKNVDIDINVEWKAEACTKTGGDFLPYDRMADKDRVQRRRSSALHTAACLRSFSLGFQGVVNPTIQSPYISHLKKAGRDHLSYCDPSALSEMKDDLNIIQVPDKTPEFEVSDLMHVLYIGLRAKHQVPSSLPSDLRSVGTEKAVSSLEMLLEDLGLLRSQLDTDDAVAAHLQSMLGLDRGATWVVQALRDSYNFLRITDNINDAWARYLMLLGWRQSLKSDEDVRTTTSKGLLEAAKETPRGAKEVCRNFFFTVENFVLPQLGENFPEENMDAFTKRFERWWPENVKVVRSLVEYMKAQEKAAMEVGGQGDMDLLLGTVLAASEKAKATPTHSKAEATLKAATPDTSQDSALARELYAQLHGDSALARLLQDEEDRRAASKKAKTPAHSTAKRSSTLAASSRAKDTLKAATPDTSQDRAFALQLLAEERGVTKSDSALARLLQDEEDRFAEHKKAKSPAHVSPSRRPSTGLLPDNDDDLRFKKTPSKKTAASPAALKRVTSATSRGMSRSRSVTDLGARLEPSRATGDASRGMSRSRSVTDLRALFEPSNATGDASRGMSRSRSVTNLRPRPTAKPSSTLAASPTAKRSSTLAAPPTAKPSDTLAASRERTDLTSDILTGSRKTPSRRDASVYRDSSARKSPSASRVGSTSISMKKGLDEVTKSIHPDFGKKKYWTDMFEKARGSCRQNLYEPQCLGLADFHFAPDFKVKDFGFLADHYGLPSFNERDDEPYRSFCAWLLHRYGKDISDGKRTGQTRNVVFDYHKTGQRGPFMPLQNFSCPVVNTANKELCGGDGVTGALLGGKNTLHNWFGKGWSEGSVRCPTGCTALTPLPHNAPDTKQTFLINTTGPNIGDSSDHRRFYRSLLSAIINPVILAANMGHDEVTEPAVSGGIYSSNNPAIALMTPAGLLWITDLLNANGVSITAHAPLAIKGGVQDCLDRVAGSGPPAGDPEARVSIYRPECVKVKDSLRSLSVSRDTSTRKSPKTTSSYRDALKTIRHMDATTPYGKWDAFDTRAVQ